MKSSTKKNAIFGGVFYNLINMTLRKANYRTPTTSPDEDLKKFVNLMMWNAVESSYLISLDPRTWHSVLLLPPADEVTVAEQVAHTVLIFPLARAGQ